MHSFRDSACSAPFLAGPAPCSVGLVHPLHRTAQAQRAGVGFEAMAPGQRLVLCEETVRERSGLGPHRDLGACEDDSRGSGCPPRRPAWSAQLASVRMPLRRELSRPVGAECGGVGVESVAPDLCDRFFHC